MRVGSLFCAPDTTGLGPRRNIHIFHVHILHIQVPHPAAAPDGSAGADAACGAFSAREALSGGLFFSRPDNPAYAGSTGLVRKAPAVKGRVC